MPLVKNTETGNHYLVKINTDGDACTRTAIRSYDKQDGSEGADGNTVFNLPFTYEPDSHTMWVYVNGQKAEYEPTMTGTVQLLQYNETDVFEVTFQVGLEDDDVIEFIVAGNYDGDVSSGSIGDLTDYLRRDGGNTFTGPGNLDLTNNAKIVQLVPGSNSTDAVNISQLGDNSLHKHENLYNNVGIVVANTSADYLGMSNKQIKFLANGSVAADAVNLGQLDTKINISGTLPFTGDQSMGTKKLTSVGTPTLGGDATNKTYVDGTYESVGGYYYDMQGGVWVAGAGSWGYHIHPGGFMSWWGTVSANLDGWYHQMNVITKMAIHPTATFSWNWSDLIAWSPTPIEVFAWTPQTTNLLHYPVYAHSSDGVNTLSIRVLHADGTSDGVKRGFAITGYAKV